MLGPALDARRRRRERGRTGRARLRRGREDPRRERPPLRDTSERLARLAVRRARHPRPRRAETQGTADPRVRDRRRLRPPRHPARGRTAPRDRRHPWACRPPLLRGSASSERVFPGFPDGPRIRKTGDSARFARAWLPSRARRGMLTLRRHDEPQIARHRPARGAPRGRGPRTGDRARMRGRRRPPARGRVPPPRRQRRDARRGPLHRTADPPQRRARRARAEVPPALPARRGRDGRGLPGRAGLDRPARRAQVPPTRARQPHRPAPLRARGEDARSPPARVDRARARRGIDGALTGARITGAALPRDGVCRGRAHEARLAARRTARSAQMPPISPRNSHHARGVITR